MSRRTDSASEYSASLTGNPFLFFETRLVAEKILEGLDQSSILTQIQEENSFQYRSTKSIPKRVNAILRRIADLDEETLNNLARGTSDRGKIIVLMAIAKRDRLFAEFLREVVHEKMNSWDPVLKDADINRFIESKAETSAKMAEWTEDAVKKLKQVYTNILVGSGIMSNRTERRLRKILLDPEFRSILLRSFSPELIKAIEG